MARSPAARRYARALFELARERGCLESVVSDLYQISQLTDRPDRYAELVGYHRLPIAEREKLWRSILEKDADPLTMRFIVFLLEKRRSDLLGEIIEHFNRMFHEAMGVLAVDIISARPLADDQVDAIKRHLREKYGKTRIQTFLRVKPELLGGFQIRIDDVVHDYSVEHQLERLHHEFITA